MPDRSSAFARTDAAIAARLRFDETLTIPFDSVSERKTSALARWGDLWLLWSLKEPFGPLRVNTPRVNSIA